MKDILNRLQMALGLVTGVLTLRTTSQIPVDDSIVEKMLIAALAQTELAAGGISRDIDDLRARRRARGK